jgi:predicted GNAT superfamily acetyltransferase
MEENNLEIKIIEGIPSNEDQEILTGLYTAIFEDAQTVFFIDRLISKKQVCSLIAFKNLIPVGFKIGYRYNDTTFYSWVGGVLPEYRKEGIAKKLAQRQELWAISNRFITLRTKSMNRYKPMMILNLINGFNIISVYTNDSNQTKVIFEKNL